MIRLIPLFILFISGVFGCFFNWFKIARFGAFLSFISFVLSIFIPRQEFIFHWFSIDKLDLGLSFIFDETELLICSVITSILSSLYLAQKIYRVDEIFNRKISALNIFSFFMCLSVLSNNMIQFFIGIEALGIISALIVGLEEKTEIQSSKVFLFNKFASLLFLIATIIIGININSFEFVDIKEFLNSSKGAVLLIPAILLLISCLCKGAQMPFSYWLIDAAKANTLASILIHAGTIVAVGIIFITKCYFIFEYFPYLKKIMVIVGLVTAFWMGCCALFKTNIKKILACLTASSAGLMFISCGIGGYSLSILYFICHAFFKSMLFLSFAYVIASMSGEQNILKMGGLSKLIPKITDVVWISFLSSIGFPFFVGFFAKISFVSALQLSDMKFLIIPNVIINMISIAAIFRMILISMYGKSRSDESTLSRVFNGNLYSMYSIWFLICISVFGSFIAWSIYEWGALHFGFAGIVYIRDFFDYFIENSMELIQIFISILFIWYFLRYSKEKIVFGMNGIFSFIFKKNEMYMLTSEGIRSFICFLMRCFSDFNKRLSSLINKMFFKTIYKSSNNLSKKHQNLLFSHVKWIFLGLFLGIISILFLE